MCKQLPLVPFLLTSRGLPQGASEEVQLRMGRVEQGSEGESFLETNPNFQHWWWQSQRSLQDKDMFVPLSWGQLEEGCSGGVCESNGCWQW